MPDMTTTDTEESELERLEIVIQSGLKAFIEVGLALLYIRDNKLYRFNHATFPLYCKARWHIGKSQSYRLISAAGVATNLLIGDSQTTLPANEAQARELAVLSPAAQRSVWQFITAIYETETITAGMVRSIAEAMQSVTFSGAVEDGDGSQVTVSNLFKASVQDYAGERMERQKAHIAAKTGSEKVGVIEGGVDELVKAIRMLPNKIYKVVIYANQEPRAIFR